jgi:hypothetical protein
MSWISKLSNRVRGAVIAGTISAVALLGSACGSVGASGTGSALTPPCTTPATHFVAVVTTGPSERGPVVTGPRLAALDAFALEAAGCHAQLQVFADPGQSLATSLWSGPTWTAASTAQLASIRAAYRIHTVIDPVIASALRHAESGAAPQLAQPADAFEVVAEAARASSGPTRGLILSSMVQADGAIDLNQPLNDGQATTLAGQLVLPSGLGSVNLTVAGVGETSDPHPAPASWLEAVRAFTSSACARTGAHGCTVTTEPNL